LFGYQGSEKDNDIYGDGNVINTHYRFEDVRLGRWFSTDPEEDEMVGESPYSAMGNNPIWKNDPKGDVWDVVADVAFIAYDLGEMAYDYAKTGKVDPISVAALGADVTCLVIPVATGGGLSVRAAKSTAKAVDKALDAKKIVTKTTDASNVVAKVEKKVAKTDLDPLSKRVSLRKGTKEEIRKNAPKTKSGNYIDPNTGKPIEKGQEVFGHKTGQEWSKYKKDPANKDKTRKEVISDQNDPKKYQIEDKKSNASHKFEEK